MWPGYSRACGLVWPMLDGLGPFDPGSNPGRPTTSSLIGESGKIIK